MSDDEADPDDVDRRTFLEATGSVALPPLAEYVGGAERRESGGSRRSVRAANRQPTLELDPNLDLGGRLVVGAPDAVGYETIQAAWNEAADGDVIVVHGSYDAETAGEPFPIALDYTDKQVMLSGGHPSGSVVDARHQPDATVVEVRGRAPEGHVENPLVRNLRIVGGNVGLRVRGGAYATFADLVVYRCTGDGVSVEARTGPEGETEGSYGITFRNCTAWRCGGAGFRLHPDAVPHATTFYGCDALFNGFDAGDPGVVLRGCSSRWADGVVQNNGGVGIDARAGASQGMTNVYVEGNGMATDSPHDVYVGETAPGFTLSECYFQGGYFRDAPNGRDRGFRAVAVAGAPGVELAGCTYQNYTDAFLHLRRTTDADVHVASHTALDDTPFQNSWDNDRLRSGGVVLETDLRQSSSDGRYPSDIGVHDGAGDAPWGLAVWNGDHWVSTMDGNAID